MDKKSPIVGYDDRYFDLHPEYTQEELYKEQEKILEIISKGSNDIAKDLDSKIDNAQIQTILRACYRNGLINRERLDVIEDKPIYRYFK